MTVNPDAVDPCVIDAESHPKRDGLRLPDDEWRLDPKRSEERAVAFYYELCRSSTVYRKKISEWKAEVGSPNFSKLVLQLAGQAKRDVIKRPSPGRASDQIAAFSWPEGTRWLAVPRELPASFEKFPHAWKKVTGDKAAVHWMNRLAPRVIPVGDKDKLPEGLLDLRDMWFEAADWEHVRDLVGMSLCCGGADPVAVFHWQWLDFTNDELVAHFRNWVRRERSYWSRFKAKEKQRTMLGPVPFLFENALHALSLRRRYHHLRRTYGITTARGEADTVRQLIDLYGGRGAETPSTNFVRDEFLRPRRAKKNRPQHEASSAESRDNALVKMVQARIRWADRLVAWIDEEYEWRADPPPPEQPKRG